MLVLLFKIEGGAILKGERGRYFDLIGACQQMDGGGDRPYSGSKSQWASG